MKKSLIFCVFLMIINWYKFGSSVINVSLLSVKIKQENFSCFFKCFFSFFFSLTVFLASFQLSLFLCLTEMCHTNCKKDPLDFQNNTWRTLKWPGMLNFMTSCGLSLNAYLQLRSTSVACYFQVHWNVWFIYTWH